MKSARSSPVSLIAILLAVATVEEVGAFSVAPARPSTASAKAMTAMSMASPRGTEEQGNGEKKTLWGPMAVSVAGWTLASQIALGATLTPAQQQYDASSHLGSYFAA